jgi:hypothetical protein
MKFTNSYVKNECSNVFRQSQKLYKYNYFSINNTN